MTALVLALTAAPSLPVDGGVAPFDGAGDLLPCPCTSVAYGSDLAGVYELLSRSRAVGVTLGQQGVEENENLRARAFADEIAAIAREEANQRGSGGGLLDSLGKVVSDVVNDLARGQPVAALDNAGSDLGAAWDSPHFWSELGTALSQVATFSSGVATVAGLVGGPVGAIAKVVAQGVVEGAEIGVALASARGEGFAASAREAQADVVWSKGSVDRLERQVRSLLEDLKSTDAAAGRALEGVGAAIFTSDRTLVSSTTSKG